MIQRGKGCRKLNKKPSTLMRIELVECRVSWLRRPEKALRRQRKWLIELGKRADGAWRAAAETTQQIKEAVTEGDDEEKRGRAKPECQFSGR